MNHENAPDVINLCLAKWRTYRMRRRIRSEASQLAVVGTMSFDVIQYIEDLEARLEAQDRELRKLRETLVNDRIADMEMAQDYLEWADKRRTLGS